MIERAKSSGKSMRLVTAALERKLSRLYPQLLLSEVWPNFTCIASAAGCTALCIRLHYDIGEEKLRTPLELMVRGSLDKEFPKASQLLDSCTLFVSDVLLEIPRGERGDYVFPILGTWVVSSVCGRERPEREEEIVADIAVAIQNETAGYWTKSNTTASSE